MWAEAASETPKITDWMQGWGSLAGVLVSTLAVVITGLLLRFEMRARREEQADNAASQARMVIIGVDAIVRQQLGWDDQSGAVKEGRVIGVDWVVTNHSAAPVLDVYVEVTINGRPTSVLEPEPDGEPTGTSSVEVIPPGKTADGRLFLVTPLPSDADSAADKSRTNITVSLTDAAGLRWRRVGRLSPERVLPHS